MSTRRNVLRLSVIWSPSLFKDRDQNWVPSNLILCCESCSISNGILRFRVICNEQLNNVKRDLWTVFVIECNSRKLLANSNITGKYPEESITFWKYSESIGTRSRLSGVLLLNKHWWRVSVNGVVCFYDYVFKK